MKNNKLYLYITLALSLFATGQTSFAKDATEPLQNVCTEDELKKLYFDPVPGHRDVVNGINDLFYHTDLERNCLKILETSNVLKPFVSGGGTYRQAYLDKYALGFVSETERNLVLLPEIEARRTLYAELEGGKRNRSESQPNELEIRQRALRETLTRYGLPASLSQSAFERIARSEARYFSAMTDMQRLEYRLRENWRVPRQVSQRSPDAFKAMMSEKINQARIANLRASVRDGLADWSGQALEFTDRQTKRRVTLRIEDLATSTVQILNGDTLASNADNNLTSSPKRRGAGLGTWFVTKFFARESLAFYSGNVVEQTQRDELIQITTPHGEVVFISGQDFTAVLNSLAPKSLSDHFTPDSISHRFRLEASARDAQLANLIGFLNGARDQTLEQLYARLSERIKNRQFDQNLASPYLTFEINSAGPKILAPSTMSDVIWYGWGILPQYWKVREERARAIGAPALSSSEPFKKQFASNTRKEKARTSWRYLTEEQRTKKFTKKSAPFAVGAILGQLWFLGLLPNPVALMHQYLPQVTLPFGLAADLDQDSMDQSAQANNYNIPAPEQDGKGGGPAKTEASAHDPASSDYRVEILKRGKGIPLPDYFNTAKLYQLPAESLDSYSYDGNKLNDMISNGNYIPMSDLTLDGNYKIHEATGRRVALVQMTNFKLNHLDLYDYQNKIIPYDSYTVYEVKNNHATYARLNPTAEARGPYTFRASYSYWPDSYAANSLNQGLPKSAVIQVMQRLKSSGFTDLTTQLEQQLPPTERIPFEALANDFAQDATYTNHGTTWWTNWLADSRFREYTKFLNDGKLFYQCTGSNLLFGRFVDETAITVQNTGIHFVPLLGFRNDDEHGSKRGEPGHLHTLVVNDADHGYLELDATPTKEDVPDRAKPGTQKSKSASANPSSPDPAKPTPIKPGATIDQPWIRPERAKIPNDPSERAEAFPVEPPPKTPENKVALKPIPRDHNEIERILFRIRQMREIAVNDLRGVLEHSTVLKQQNLVDLPGVRLVVLSKILLRGFEDKQTPEHLLHTLQDPKNLAHGKVRPLDREHARVQLNQYFASELVSFRRSLSQLEIESREGRNSQFEFLTYDPVRSHLRELIEVLSVYTWGDLLEQYHAAPKCKDALSAR